MKFKTLILGIVAAAAVFTGAECVLDKTQEEALKFLVDGGHISKEATVESFTLDRNKNVRIRVAEGEQIRSFGLEEGEDTYEITFMSKKKAPKTVTKKEETEEIKTLIGENMEVLKGGEVTSITNASGRRNHGQVSIGYKLNGKDYTIDAYYSAKRGELNIKSVKEVKSETKTQL